MLIPDFLLRLLGREISEKLNLEGGPMDETKKWYLSKTIWSSVISGIIGIYLSLVSGGVHLPAIPGWISTVLGAVGVYGRVTADTKIG